jgi:hypothetical protein
VAAMPWCFERVLGSVKEIIGVRFDELAS